MFNMRSPVQLFHPHSGNCTSVLLQLKLAREKHSTGKLSNKKEASDASKMRVLSLQTSSQVVVEEHCSYQPITESAEEKSAGIMSHPDVKKREAEANARANEYQLATLLNELKYRDLRILSIKQRHERDMKEKDDRIREQDALLKKRDSRIEELEQRLEELRELFSKRNEDIDDLEEELSSKEEALAATTAALQKEKDQRTKSARHHKDVTNKLRRVIREQNEQLNSPQQSFSRAVSSSSSSGSNNKHDNDQTVGSAPASTETVVKRKRNPTQPATTEDTLSASPVDGTTGEKRSLRELLEDSTAEDAPAQVAPQPEQAQAPAFIRNPFGVIGARNNIYNAPAIIPQTNNSIQDLAYANNTNRSYTHIPAPNPTNRVDANDYIYKNLHDLQDLVAASSPCTPAPIHRACGPIQLAPAPIGARTPYSYQTPVHQQIQPYESYTSLRDLVAHSAPSPGPGPVPARPFRQARVPKPARPYQARVPYETIPQQTPFSKLGQVEYERRLHHEMHPMTQITFDVQVGVDRGQHEGESEVGQAYEMLV
ncbi:hypothetical protein DM02DRAFT_622070 [Periconia macrospinosa]|uniref:Uncharacterized protein n=1 Tax=Periconia macrospinosa TaxID=97972 RepID=A0A2V1EAK3_9PLEO|nr:hypothetical protein DM02DRAFT_622070 [Periconia macrospinosa]